MTHDHPIIHLNDIYLHEFVTHGLYINHSTFHAYNLLGGYIMHAWAYD